MPLYSRKTPLSSTQTPSSCSQTPPTCTQTPTTRTQTPISFTQTPFASTHTPLSFTQTPISRPSKHTKARKHGLLIQSGRNPGLIILLGLPFEEHRIVVCHDTDEFPSIFSELHELARHGDRQGFPRPPSGLPRPQKKLPGDRQGLPHAHYALIWSSPCAKTARSLDVSTCNNFCSAS